MLSKIFSAAVLGLDAQIIEIETDVCSGLRCFNIVGLADKAVEESKERISAAIKNTGFKSPHQQTQRILANLAPADIKKQGSLYDLPIALGYLSASKQIQFIPENKIFIGELSLDGSLKKIKGALSIALMAKDKGYSEIILPKANALEAGLIQGLKIIGAESLKQIIEHLEGKTKISPLKIDIKELIKNPTYSIELDWIKGQEYAKRALEIAASGGHNLLMQGPPGTGKTLLAKAITSILPSLSFEEALEVSKIYSLAGLLPQDQPLINFRPFRSPHHASSEAALIGSGNPPRPGEITLAHQGVLFLDEFPEFHRDALESLRQPMEEGKITILRAKHSLSLPARFTLVAATNPCPCGYLNDPEKNCSCQPAQVAKYRRKLSGPLMDRIDLFIEVPPLKYEKLIAPDAENLTFKTRQKVEKARQKQKQRFSKEKGFLSLINSEIPISKIKEYCQIDLKTKGLIRSYVNSGKLSARGYHRVLKTARTIADLENSENIQYHHVSEALMYRVKQEV